MADPFLTGLGRGAPFHQYFYCHLFHVLLKPAQYILVMLRVDIAVPRSKETPGKLAWRRGDYPWQRRRTPSGKALPLLRARDWRGHASTFCKFHACGETGLRLSRGGRQPGGPRPRAHVVRPCRADRRHQFQYLAGFHAVHDASYRRSCVRPEHCGYRALCQAPLGNPTNDFGRRTSRKLAKKCLLNHGWPNLSMTLAPCG